MGIDQQVGPSLNDKASMRVADGVAREPSPRSRVLNRQTMSAIDLAVMVAAFVLAYLLRFEFAIPLRDLEL